MGQPEDFMVWKVILSLGCNQMNADMVTEKTECWISIEGGFHWKLTDQKRRILSQIWNAQSLFTSDTMKLHTVSKVWNKYGLCHSDQPWVAFIDRKYTVYKNCKSRRWDNAIMDHWHLVSCKCPGINPGHHVGCIPSHSLTRQVVWHSKK